MNSGQSGRPFTTVFARYGSDHCAHCRGRLEPDASDAGRCAACRRPVHTDPRCAGDDVILGGPDSNGVRFFRRRM